MNSQLLSVNLLCVSLCTLWQSICDHSCSSVVNVGSLLDKFGATLDNFGIVWAHVGNTKNTQNRIDALKTQICQKINIFTAIAAQSHLRYNHPGLNLTGEFTDA